jgi:molybdopterin converting factor small subunit
MRVTVRYLAQLRQAAGCTAETIDLDAPCSPQELLLRLADRHGDGFRQLLLDRGQPQPSLLLFVGEEQVRGDASRQLRDGDEVLILSPMAGG